MTDRIAIVALTPLQYEGMPVAAGELVLVKPLEAAAFVYQQKARHVAREEAPPMAPTGPRRRYKRRDLEAE